MAINILKYICNIYIRAVPNIVVFDFFCSKGLKCLQTDEKKSLKVLAFNINPNIVRTPTKVSWFLLLSKY